MSLLIRKINKAKWFQVDIVNNSDVSADAITNCLKTTDNTLSVWNIENEEYLNNAILAIVSNQDHLETIDIVIIDQDSLENKNVNIVISPGNIPILKLIDTHRDITDLTYSKLGFVKDFIVESIRNDQLKRYTVGSLKKILKNAIEEGYLRKTDLKPSLQVSIK